MANDLKVRVSFQTLTLKKRFPLRISRGSISEEHNLFVHVSRGGLTGIGEMAPGENQGVETPEAGQICLEEFCASSQFDPEAIRQNYVNALNAGVAPCALAALDMALWDLRAKEANMPLHRLLGVPKPLAQTSMTIGINPPDVVRDRVPFLLASGAKALKLKLGSSEGIEVDREIFLAAKEALGSQEIPLRVDANGGWSLQEAKEIIPWLAQMGAEYVEQPLEKGQEQLLPELFEGRPIPIYLDESCEFASDVPKLAECADGVNLKLMKSGGITGALGIIATTRAHGLSVMIGCMGESSISISAGASISGLCDHIDLDSHLNLAPDPAEGPILVDGKIYPNERVGHGGALLNA